jgi:hypothetical protein
MTLNYLYVDIGRFDVLVMNELYLDFHVNDKIVNKPAIRIVSLRYEIKPDRLYPLHLARYIRGPIYLVQSPVFAYQINMTTIAIRGDVQIADGLIIKDFLFNCPFYAFI